MKLERFAALAYALPSGVSLLVGDTHKKVPESNYELSYKVNELNLLLPRCQEVSTGELPCELVNM